MKQSLHDLCMGSGDRIDKIRNALSQGANPNSVVEGVTPIMVASKWGNTKQVRILHKAGARLDNAVREAIFWRQSDVLGTLIEFGADFDGANSDDQNALHEACASVYPEIVEVLLEAGIDIKSRDKQGRTPLHLALHQRRPHQMGDLNIMQYGDLNLPHDGDVWRDTTDLLLAYGADPNQCDNENNTPLHYAFQQGVLNAAALLVAVGADLDAKNLQDLTPTSIAEHHGYSRQVETLFELRAFPLHLAALAGGTGRTLKRLVSSGCSLNRRTDQGHTALHYAVYFTQHILPIILLIEYGEDVNIPDEDGDTPLHGAAEKAHTAQVRILLDNGADRLSQNKAGLTPLEVARKHKPSEDIFDRNEDGDELNEKVGDYSSTILMLEEAN